MEDREYDNTLRLSDEEDRARKPPQQYSTNVAMDDLIVLRILVCVLDCPVKLVYETVSEAVKL